MWTRAYKPLYGPVMKDDPRRRWEANFIRSMEQRRRSLGMTQTDLARELKRLYDLPFHQQTIQRIETGERPVRLDESHCIAETLGLSLAVMTADTGGTAEDLEYLIDLLYDELSERGLAILDGIELHTQELESLFNTLTEAWENYEERMKDRGGHVDVQLSAKVRRATTRYDRFKQGLALLNELTDL